MKKISIYFFLLFISATILSCTKEYSVENGDNLNDPLIVGVNCRIAKIAYNDSSTAIPKGSISANINLKDTVLNITQFDSLAFTILFYTGLNYFSDTIRINPYEYFVTDVANGGRVSRLHDLTDPADTLSPQFDVDYSYDGAGHLTSKSYSFSSNPGVPYYIVNYNYTGSNLTGMTGTDVSFGSNLVVDAVLDYYNGLNPQSYMYLFPDELAYSPYTQFLNFGTRSRSAIKNLKVRYYDPGPVVRDSTVSNFTGYLMSRDNYVLGVYMNGDDQFSIPAQAGKLSFSYKCK